MDAIELPCGIECEHTPGMAATRAAKPSSNWPADVESIEGGTDADAAQR
jgi:hypothetical protein